MATSELVTVFEGGNAVAGGGVPVRPPAPVTRTVGRGAAESAMARDLVAQYRSRWSRIAAENLDGAYSRQREAEKSRMR
jgi:hypothetical protein